MQQHWILTPGVGGGVATHRLSPVTRCRCEVVQLPLASLSTDAGSSGNVGEGSVMMMLQGFGVGAAPGVFTINYRCADGLHIFYSVV